MQFVSRFYSPHKEAYRHLAAEPRKLILFLSSYKISHQIDVDWVWDFVWGWASVMLPLGGDTLNKVTGSER